MKLRGKLINQQSRLENVRMGCDLKIASTLSTVLRNDNYITILDGGYGVDTVCNGKLTRFHHDLDLIILQKDIQVDEARKIVLRNTGEAGWVENKTSPGWLWFTKDDPTKPNLPRQINIHLVNLSKKSSSTHILKACSSKGKPYGLEVTESYVRTPDDIVYKLKTLVPEEYAATKLRLIPKYAPDWKIRDCDEYDLGLLFQYPNFNIEKCYSILESYYAAINDGYSNLDKSHPATSFELFSQFESKFPHVLKKDQKDFIKSFPKV